MRTWELKQALQTVTQEATFTVPQACGSEGDREHAVQITDASAAHHHTT